MNLAALLSGAAARWPDLRAVTLGGRTVHDYRTLGERAARLAGALRGRLGMQAGDRVAIAMANAPEYVEVLFAAWHAGLAAVPINAKLHPREFAYILADSGARACFVTEALEGAIAEAAADAPALAAVIRAGGPEYARLLEADARPVHDGAADDLAWLFYTSGTTGRPKGAMLSHGNLAAMTVRYFADVDTVAPGDSIVHAAPMSHGSGLYILPHIARGACQAIPESGGFEPEEVLALIRAHSGVTFFFAPTMVMRLVNAPALGAADLRNLKTVVYGGAPMYVENSLAAVAALGPRLVQIYGQGESPMTITCLARAAHEDAHHPCYRDRLASVGRPFTGIDVAVCDAEDRTLPPGEAGEILVRGATVMGGYWRNAAANETALRGGWLHTGDVGSFDDDGFLTLKDRSKDVIISGGSNIYPREVEEVLLRHPAVAECAVVGRPHADWGEQVMAFVVPAPGAAVGEAELDALCLAHIARFKRPRAYRFVDALPKNNYGKVLKTALRARG